MAGEVVEYPLTLHWPSTNKGYKMTKKKQTKKQTKNPPRDATPQDIADIFRDYAEFIQREANPFAEQQFAPKLIRKYCTYWQLLETLRKNTHRYFPERTELDELPAIKDNAFLGSFSLVGYCKKQMAILTDEAEGTIKAPSTQAGLMRHYCDMNPDLILLKCVELIEKTLNKSVSEKYIRKIFYPYKKTQQNTKS